MEETPATGALADAKDALRVADGRLQTFSGRASGTVEAAGRIGAAGMEAEFDGSMGKLKKSEADGRLGLAGAPAAGDPDGDALSANPAMSEKSITWMSLSSVDGTSRARRGAVEVNNEDFVVEVNGASSAFETTSSFSAFAL